MYIIMIELLKTTVPGGCLDTVTYLDLHTFSDGLFESANRCHFITTIILAET